MKKSEVLRNKICFQLARPIGRVMLKKYDFKTDYVPKQKEPYILMANHTTELDMFMVGIANRRHIYYVAGEHLFRTWFGKPLAYLINPIPMPKGYPSMAPVKEMLSRIKDGHSIMIFPEGSRNFHGETIPVELATGKLVKTAHCGLVTYRTNGGYFTAPRWAYKSRKGPVDGKVMGVYSSEELKKMTVQEITDLINRDLYVNAYDNQRKEMRRYECDTPAEGMENYLVICPECGSYDTLETSCDTFRCRNCGMKGRYNEYGFLHGDKVRFDSVYDWGKWIEGRFDEDMEKKEPGELLFQEDNIRLFTIDATEHTQWDLAEGKLLVYEDRLCLGNRTFLFDDISVMAMLYYGQTLLFTCGKKYYGITGDNFHAWKCNRLYENYKFK